MRQSIFLLRIFLLIVVLLVSGCNKNQQAKEQNQNQPINLRAAQIKIEGLKEVLIKLQNRQTAYQFIGITSKGVDCIYFISENGKFNLEFEAISKDQLPFLDKLIKFAKTNNFKYLMTTYKNQPNDQSDQPAPVLRIETNATIDEATNLGTTIQTKIFHNDNKTVYDVVP